MRFEELNIGKIEAVRGKIDTILMTFGGLTWRPAHLPIGTTWYILRKLRDEVETAFGERILTLPVQSIDTTFDDSAIAKLPQESYGSFVTHYVQELMRHFEVRQIILLTDSLYKEQLILQTLSQETVQKLRILPFVWWRDGLRLDGETNVAAQNTFMQTHEFHPSGVLETALMMALADHLVVRDKASLLRYRAQDASTHEGSLLWNQLVRQLLQQAHHFLSE
ncbi:creatininase family protein [Sulfoacidibacillus thermotolerans]|uniref:Uncharacterized protein n=1 Tax=Sulfoacidibacillus thermotolerans TaxID=1765684 RepID=A0A2U3D732_SULT2|nr:creatininase family protein [Sulfoacidibacillus thermotolerans]PWI57063.1 hypothetical protein BM613_10445 [Sulfoacidibacillus thermotolerans]